ncbi:hypothetical protein evm_003444 [Chilo suppressalis]|nr:hypothetical protein evm_003444 [Chilo suppressalis]
MAPKNLDYLELASQRAREKKTHVSFPQLKYPSLRDEGLKDPVQWLIGKAMDDGAEGLWRIHDSLYNFDTFIDSHPGGSEWLQLTKGTDITEAFEAHHVKLIAEKMLEKYFVKNVTTPRNSPYTFKEDGFYRTLKRAVREELKKVPKNIPQHANRIIDGLFVTCLITAALTCWAKNYWIVMISYLISSLTLAWCTVASHNYIHKKSNWRMYLFNLSLWSYSDFRISHVLSHHLYTNTLMDLEISAFEPIVQWNPRPDKSFITYFSPLFQCIFFPLNFIMHFVQRLGLNFVRRDPCMVSFGETLPQTGALKSPHKHQFCI